jgi:hypothetical protein
LTFSIQPKFKEKKIGAKRKKKLEEEKFFKNLVDVKHLRNGPWRNVELETLVSFLPRLFLFHWKRTTALLILFLLFKVLLSAKSLSSYYFLLEYQNDVSFNIERLNESSNVFLHRVFQNQFMQI